MSARRGKLRGQKALEKRVLRIAKRVQKELGMSVWWDVAHVFNRQDGEDNTTACVTEAKWQYRMAQLTWNLDAIMGQRDKQLYEICVHEYCHILMSPIHKHLAKAKDGDAEELATESFARALLRMRKTK